MKKLLIVLLVFIALYFFYSNFNQQKVQIPNPTPTQAQKVSPPEGWKKYTDDKLRFSFFAPPEFVFEANGQYSVIAKHPTSQSKVGDVEFFYISVVPENLFDSETGEAYNYQKSFHKKLLSIKVGETKNLSTIDEQKDWYMYERNGDTMINGHVAKVFLNQRPWEFPAGIWEYRYILEYPKKTIVTGGYIVGGPSDTPLSLPVFEKMISTLEISPY